MTVAAYEGIVENGCVRLPAGVLLPEKTRVYVIVPGTAEGEVQRVVHIRSPRLAHPEQARDFVLEVTRIEEDTDADS